MSKKWVVVGSSSLDVWEPENEISDLKEKARLKWQRRHKLFKQTLKLDKQKTEKPKKHYKEEIGEEE